MRSRVFPAVVPILLAACAPALSPAGAPDASAPGTADVPPVLALLDERERLALSSDQVVALESIARDWEAANDALARRRPPIPLPLPLALGKQAMMTRAAILENNRRTLQAVERVLQPGQRQALCTTQRLRGELASTMRAAKGRADAKSVSTSGKARGQAVQASRRTETPRAWPWCSPSRADEARSAS